MGDSLAQVSTWIYLKAWKTNQLGAARLVLLAPDEWAAGQVRIKTLSTGTEQNVPLDQLTETSRA